MRKEDDLDVYGSRQWGFALLMGLMWPIGTVVWGLGVYYVLQIWGCRSPLVWGLASGALVAVGWPSWLSTMVVQVGIGSDGLRLDSLYSTRRVPWSDVVRVSNRTWGCFVYTRQSKRAYMIARTIDGYVELIARIQSVVDQRFDRAADNS